MLTLNPSFHTTGSFKKWLLVFTTNFICCSLCYYYCALMIYTVDEILKITCKMAENQSFAIKIKFFVQKINLSNILTCQEQRRKPYMSVCAHLHTRFHVTKCRNNDSNSNLWEKNTARKHILRNKRSPSTGSCSKACCLKHQQACIRMQGFIINPHNNSQNNVAYGKIKVEQLQAP